MAELLPAAREPAPLDASIIVSLVSVGAVGGLMALAALVVLGPASGLGVAVGGLIATLNLWFFAHIGRGVLAGGSRGRLWGLIAATKFIGLFGGAWLLLQADLTQPLTLAIGYAALPLGITIGSFLRREDSGEPTRGGFDPSSAPAENLVPADPESDTLHEPRDQA